MSCPFPGMDPWLEGLPFWQGFHNGLMHYIQEDLQPRLPAKYGATLELRIYFEPASEGASTGRQRVPDLEVVRTAPASSRKAVAASAGPYAGTLLEIDAVEVREAYVSVREIPSGRLVTSIEMLSPANKQAVPGRDAYRAKQWRLYGQGVNLVELDFLRGGLNTVLVSAARLSRLGPFHYLADVLRAHDPLKYQAITWSVREPFPTVPVPLDEGVSEVPLGLGHVFGRTFDTGAFRRLLNYRGEPDPPLAPEDAVWAGRLLRDAGLREATGD